MTNAKSQIPFMKFQKQTNYQVTPLVVSLAVPRHRTAKRGRQVRLAQRILMQMRSVYTIALFLLVLNLIDCAKFRKKTVSYEPVSIQLIDESRTENLKIRHIFNEFLLKEIIHKGKDGICITHVDISDNKDIDLGDVDYLISFDIMEFRTFEIEKGTRKLLVSAKIIEDSSRNILSSYVASAVGKDIEYICQDVADNISSAITKKLLSLRKCKYEVPETQIEFGDSL